MVNGQGIRQQGMQEVDIISMVKQVTKYAALVTEPQDIKYHLDRALYEAVHGRKRASLAGYSVGYTGMHDRGNNLKRLETRRDSRTGKKMKRENGWNNR